MKSEWMKNSKTLYKKLNKDIECDVLIVGAGMSGLLCAYQLQNRFERIVIIESDEICSGASGRSTGKLTSQHGLNYQEILKIHGKEKTSLYYEENEKAIKGIKDIIDEFKIECDFMMKDAIVGCKSKYLNKTVNQEIKAYDICHIPYEVIQENEMEEIHYGVKFKNQASFDPYKFCIQLAKNLNVEIYENTPMIHIHDHAISTNHNHIKYKHCILATLVMPFQFKFFYAISKPNSSFLAALSPSNKDDKMYLIDDEITKTRNDLNDFMLIGGYDHPMSDDINFKWQAFKRDLVLEYPNHKILSAWSSQDYEVFDYLPIVDICDDFIIISGFNKWGNSNSFVASLVIKDILTNQQTSRRELFTLRRSSLVINKNFLGENFQVLKSLILSKSENESFSIPNNHEAIHFKIDNHPYGIYRDEEKLYIVDTLCPHLGCTLKFNQHERSWDCPCHGSRFDIQGKIIKGPANVSLHHNISHVDVFKKK